MKTKKLEGLIAKDKITKDSFICFVDNFSSDGTWNIIQVLNRNKFLNE